MIFCRKERESIELVCLLWQEGEKRERERECGGAEERGEGKGRVGRGLHETSQVRSPTRSSDGKALTMLHTRYVPRKAALAVCVYNCLGVSYRHSRPK